METLLIFFSSGTLSVIGNALLKSGMNEAKGLSFSLITNWRIIVGFAFYGLSSILYLKLLSALEVTKVYPALVAYMFIMLLLLGTIFLKESLTLTKVAGIIIIIAGIFLSSR
ncbi:hypothetical protein HY085_00080 [Candidatus Gottesmanbacteria bacterium]|nr:hypothetical protein [Candidatus Gottesmanbacteria bacterium]